MALAPFNGSEANRLFLSTWLDDVDHFLAICGPRLEPGAPVRIDGGAVPEGLVSIAWRRPDGKRVWMAWAHQPMNVGLVDLVGGAAGAARPATWHQPVAATQREVRIEVGQPLRLDVGTELQILVW